jgi:hypothetical protein
MEERNSTDSGIVVMKASEENIGTLSSSCRLALFFSVLSVFSVVQD